MTAAERDAIIRRVADAAARMLDAGQQGTTVEMPELGENWTISREPGWNPHRAALRIALGAADHLRVSRPDDGR